ncbi:MAG: hypothetical protein ACTHOF_10510 [Flavisolibacter sp.]|jgi:hypothetical protein
MHHIFSPAILASNDISCSKCDWQGKGKDIKLEELLLTDAVELYCPSCNGYLGFISEPYKADNEN